MDVRLPDGTVIKNVPDGTTKADLVAKLQRNGMAVPSEWLGSNPSPKQAEPQADPSEGGSTLQVYNPFGKNLDTGLKLGQATTRTLAGIGSGIDDLVSGAGQRVGLIDQAAIDEKKKLDAPLKKTTAGTVGSVVGKVAVGLPAAFVPGANTVAGAGLIGAGQGVFEPTASDESVIKNMLIGGAAGSGGVVLGRALRAGYNGIKGLIEPFTEAGQQRIAGRVLERFADNPNALRTASSAPTATGAIPTLAESAKDRGVAALQRSLETQDPQVASMFAQRAADNNAARVSTLGSIAGDQSTRSAAVAARDAAAGDMYKTATGAVYKVDDELAGLLKRPAVQQAMQRAKNLAENEGRTFAFNVTSKAPFSGVGGAQSQGSQQITGQGLQDLKMAMDEMLSDPASGFAGKAGKSVESLKNQIVGWMEKANPDFKTARTAYAQASKPINAMDVGQRLLEKGGPAIRDIDGGKRLSAAAFSRLLDDEQSLIRSSTGFKGANALESVMTPDQVNKLGAIRNELELASNLASAANGPGSQTAKSLASKNLLRQIMGPTGLPESWSESTLLQSLMRPAQFAMTIPEQRLQNKLAEVLLDPSKAKNALSAAEIKQINPLLEKLSPYAKQIGAQSLSASAVSRKR